MRSSFAGLGAVMLLAGCNPSGDQTQQATARPIKVQGEEQRQLAAANAMDRSIALKRAIYDSGSTCTRVTRTGFVTDYKNMSMWQAACDDGRDWAIFIAGNGNIQVRPCADLKDLKLPLCTFPPEPAATRKAAKPAA